MRYLIAFFLLLSGCTPAIAQSNQVVIAYPGYTSYWNPKTLIPDSVIWIASPHKKAVGREAAFHSTGGRVNLSKDYAKSGYDIGHNCDASDENGNKTDEYNSFDFANTFPQKPNNNRLVWLQLENYTRQLNQPVRVKVYWQGISGYLSPDKVAIPIYTIKELRHGGKFEKYVIPNNDTVSKHSFTFYKVK
jgi:endonuclease G